MLYNFKAILCSLVILYLSSSTSQSSFFLAKQYGNNNYICVTNSSSALSWIQEDITEKFYYVSTYIPVPKPEQKSSEINCDIKNDRKTKRYFVKEPWQLQSSLQSDINQPVLDARWEEMEVVKTEFVEPKFVKLKYKLIQNMVVKYDSFDIPLSIRILQDGHIFLCDGEYPPKARCYWFMLQAFDGNASALRKCEKDYIPAKHGDWPKAPCNERKVSIDHTIHSNSYLSNKKWSHFILSKRKNILTLKQFTGHKETKIMEWPDDGTPINVTDMIVHSKIVNGLWKIHNIDFIYTNVESSDVNLGPFIYGKHGFVCISMYIAMCSSCKLKLSLVADKVVVTEEIFEIKHAGWTQIKFISEKAYYPNGLKLLVSTISTNQNAYWAIDKIRSCQRQEFRTIGLSEEAPCQLISDPEQVAKYMSYSTINSNTNCPEDTVGDFCVKCDWIFENCEQITICNEQQCVCSAGYRDHSGYSGTTTCYSECPDNKYGHGCQRNCGKCPWSSSCNKIDGTCPRGRCTENYSGPKCDIPPATIFANPPKITEISYTEATVEVSNFVLGNSGTDQTPQYYIIEYKKAQATNTDWKHTNNQFHQFNMPGTFKLTNLEPETQYFVRSVIIDKNGQWQHGDHLKFSEFTTSCEEISDNDIKIAALNTTARIKLLLATTMTCKTYSITLFEKPEIGVSNSSGTFFTDLLPYNNYTVKVSGKNKTHEKKFRTDEGVPTSVLSLTATATSATSVNLMWTEPQHINGAFRHFVVNYQLISYQGCDATLSQSSVKSDKKIKGTTLTITDLIPYTMYEFTVFAVNTKFSGPPTSQKAATFSSEKIHSEEIPNIININTTHVSANIEVSKIKCENIRGPLMVEVTTKCTSEWCQSQHRNSRTEEKRFPNMAIVQVDNLESFSDYELELKFCRDHGSCTESQKRKFKTETTVPRKVTDLLVYTKNTSSISLRWKPPYPPTGILKEYKIVWSTYRNEINDEIAAQITPCTLWPELHCATLSNLPSEVYIILKIYAKNEHPIEFGEFAEIRKTTKIEKSSAPYDLKINWTLQNDLQMEWKHPNETNGDVSYFEVQINTADQRQVVIQQKFNVSRETYNLTYRYVVNGSELQPTKPYIINVYAFNDQLGDAVVQRISTPPDVPTLSTDADFTSSNDSFTISVSPQKVRGSTDTYRLFVLRPDEQSNLELYQNIQKYDLNKDLKVVVDCDVSQILDTFEIYLGSDQQHSGCNDIDNLALQPASTYNITIVLLNVFRNESRANIYSYNQTTMGEPLPLVVDSSLFALFALLLIIPLIAFLYVKRDKLKDNLLKQDNPSTEILEIKEDQIPLAQVTQPNINVQVPKKPVKIPPKPTIDTTNTTTTSKIYSKSIKITEFEEYVKDSIKNGELERQHALFPRGQTKPWTHGSMKENKSKNRYNNLIAYDHTRVILEKIGNNPNSDYVNANYIDGHKVRKAYIATQGPKVATLNDFWRMIWQENVRYIANLANIYEGGKKKLEKYWPDINETLQFGDVTVQHVSRNVYADYEHRVFTVTHKEESRKVEQLHFSSWPDHGVPLYSQSLVPFLQTILQIPLSSKSPVVVHCSAGVGRTGTILLCDICLRMAAREGTIDVLRNLQLLRDQRANMVDNIEQYKLAHLVVLECLVGLHTSIQCSEIDEAVQKVLTNGSLVLQMRYLKDTQWQDQAMKTVGQTGEEAMVVREKNRFQNIIPEIQGRVFITRYPPSDETSSYINAIKVDGFRSPGRFIVTQQPLHNTVGDFWRLVDENSTSTYSVVISLNDINPKDATSCDFWPTTTNPHMTPLPLITLQHQNTLSSEFYDVITLHLHSESRKEFLPVQILSMKNWAPKAKLPKSPEEFLTFLEQADSATRGTNPIFVTCYDGVKASGLFVAMSFIIEKMKLEQVCNVCQAVRTIRHNRQQFVQDLEQFEFLYKAAVLYINGFESYANFN